MSATTFPKVEAVKIFIRSVYKTHIIEVKHDLLTLYHVQGTAFNVAIVSLLSFIKKSNLSFHSSSENLDSHFDAYAYA